MNHSTPGLPVHHQLLEFTVKGIVMIASGAALASLNVVLVRARKEAGK